MSVPVNSRSISRLEVNVQAHDLCVYTLVITANKKIFTDTYQTVLTDKIVDCAIGIHTMCWCANNIQVNSVETYSERRRLQESAAVRCNELLALIDLARKIFHLRASRVLYWSDKVVAVRNLIRAWRKSDDTRYPEYRHKRGVD